MVKSLRTLKTTVDNRANDKYISEYFIYIDVNYPEYFTLYTHLFNIDSVYPYILIRQEAYERMLEEGIICER